MDTNPTQGAPGADGLAAAIGRLTADLTITAPLGSSTPHNLSGLAVTVAPGKTVLLILQVLFSDAARR